MMLSMVIPTYTINPYLEELTIRAIASYIDQVDELIIVEDGGMFSPKLIEASDIYIKHKKNIGFTKNVNSGWKIATGDYVAIVNSDTELISGNLLDLCIPGKVTSPYLNIETPGLAGSFFVVPRIVAQQQGMLNEKLHTYCSDAEYESRILDIFLAVDSVRVYHHNQQTTKDAFKNEDRHIADNKMYDKLHGSK